MSPVRSLKTDLSQIFFWLACAVLASGGATAQSAVATRVDPRVELVTTVARLAGFSEFTMANSTSPYAARVERHFAPWREHAVVRLLQELRARQGVSHDAVATLAVHLDAIETLAELVPFDPQPERLDARWTPATAREFVVALRDFAKLSDAAKFFRGEREFFAQVEQRLGERLGQSKALPWFDAFFGAKPGASYVAIAGLLCGGNAFGVGVRFADGSPERISPVFGCWEWDEAGLPVFGEVYLPLYVHELCHTYTNPFVDRFASELEASGTRLFQACAPGMRRQAYTTWKIVVGESLVRACVVRCRLATEGEAAAKEQAREEVARLFAWVPELAASFSAYEADRERYPTFESFMPQVVAFFERYAERLDKEDAARPQVMSIEPANAATDVDPGATELVIRFDRAMLDQSWSIAGAPAEQPEITGKPAYDEQRTTLRVPIRLERGRSYRFWLNTEQKTGFKSADGVPLAPLEVTFTTLR